MHCYSSRQELYYWLAGVWLELCVGQAFFLSWEVLSLELIGNSRLGSKSSGGCAGMNLGHFGELSSMLGRWSPRGYLLPFSSCPPLGLFCCCWGNVGGIFKLSFSQSGLDSFSG